MDDRFHREYLVRLPLPLAQLYSRAHNGKLARARHDNAFYLCEALIKLAATPLIATYLDGVSRGEPHVEAIDRQLPAVKLPSLGHWMGMLRELARHFGLRVDSETHPLGHLWDQLNARRTDWSAVLELFRKIKNGPDGQPANVKGCSALELFDALVQYRNTVFGHGASRVDSFYEEQMGPLLLPAVSDLLAEGVLDILGPRGSRLVLLAEIRAVGDQRMEIELRHLVGRESERAAPLEVSAEEAVGLAPGCVAVHWPGQAVPRRLDPLLTYRETDLAEEVLFLNRDHSGKHVEFLSYTTGQTVRDPGMEPAMERLLASMPSCEPRAVAARDPTKATSEDNTATSETANTTSGLPQTRDFEILAEIGRGGMGVVYLARQLSLGRLVALKTISADLLDDEIALARFRREIRVLGRCDHPNIVKVFACGALPDGQLYYAMEYVPGADLSQVWRELSGASKSTRQPDRSWSAAVRSASQRQLEETQKSSSKPQLDFSSGSQSVLPAAMGFAPAVASAETTPVALPTLPESSTLDDDEDLVAYQRRVAGLMRDVASALDVVHKQQIIHRDVKLANLILSADGSRVVLMDFGLAKGQSMMLTNSRAGGLLGTLRYASPEQLAAANLPVGPGVDIRGLGVAIWELLTRQRLFAEAEDERQLASWVLNHDVPLLRSINPALSPALEAIVAKATERNADERMQSAAELVGFLDLFLAGKPVTIGAPTTAQRLLVRSAVPIVILAALVPNGLAGVFNYFYNNDAIIRHLSPESQATFWTTQSVINSIAYPLGVTILGVMAFLAVRPLTRAWREGGADADAFRVARQRSMLLGHYSSITGICLWVVAGIAYPISIRVAAGEMPPAGYLHFFGSLALCGLIAAAYPFFLSTWYGVFVIHPFLSRGQAYTPLDRQLHKRLNRLLWRYFVCAASVPMVAVTILVSIDTDSRFAIAIFAVGGLLGFAMVAPIFKKLLDRLTPKAA